MVVTEHPPHLLPLPVFRRGKVRDSYDLGDRLLMVASDRVSAFDVVLPNTIPGKGIILSQLSAFWFDRTRHIIQNHLISSDTTPTAEIAGMTDEHVQAVRGRAMVVRKAERIDVECVVRGYLFGSVWSEYQDRGTVAGVPSPSGLALAERLPEPVFSPAMKLDTGHDINVGKSEVASLLGQELANRLEATSIALYRFGADHAWQRGCILADTKFEFGFVNGELTLIDEALTPDSSRYWDRPSYAPGSDPPSLDKQFLRSWLESSGWDKQPPGPAVPAEVVSGTLSRYRSAYERLTGTPAPVDAEGSFCGG